MRFWTDRQAGQGTAAEDPTGVSRAFAEESLEGLRLTVRGRLLALAALAVLMPVFAPFPDFLFYYLLLAFFALATFGLVYLHAKRMLGSSIPYVLTACDFVMLTFFLVYPNPIGDVASLPEQYFQSRNFAFFYVLLIVLALNYQPRLVLWGGIAGAVSWSIGAVWLNAQFANAAYFPTLRAAVADIAVGPPPDGLDPGEWLEGRIEEAVIFLLTAALLAIVVQRSRRLVMRQVHLARERNNLARYFPPSMIDALSHRDTPLGDARELTVTVLFADIVGFTKWAETQRPPDVIEFLRQVHARIEDAVFVHHGTLDKFMGDGVMATFGTPEPRPDDAANALRCARHILAGFDAWNAERRGAGLDDVRVSLGIHTGPAVMGDIGSARRLELAVLGDTVNLASRLEGVTRQLDCRIAVSADTIDAVRKTGVADAAALAGGFTHHGPVALRGREQGIGVWTA